MHKQIIVVLIVVFGSAGPAPVSAGFLTNDLLAFTSSQTREYGPVNLFAYGTTSTGGFNTNGAFDTARTAWVPGEFGMYAFTALNSMTAGQGGFSIARGISKESMLIAPQQGAAQGDPGVFHLSYHLDGSVIIDVGVTLDSGGLVASFGRVHYSWGFLAGDVGASLNNLGVNQQETWLGNQVSAIIDLDVDVPIPFKFGVPFYYYTDFRLEAGAGSSFGPSQGRAEADFFNTGTLLGGAVFDQYGNRILNPLVISDSGFDYVNPQSVSAVPEPSTLVLSSILFCMIGGVWSFKRLSQSTAAA